MVCCSFLSLFAVASERKSLDSSVSLSVQGAPDLASVSYPPDLPPSSTSDQSVIAMSPRASEVDLLIIGAGPAGLMAAAWASSCELNARMIDEKDARVKTGQADGLHCRTLEIMDSFGRPSIAHEILGQACVIKEISSWACT
jgi:hypothetical protein